MKLVMIALLTSACTMQQTADQTGEDAGGNRDNPTDGGGAGRDSGSGSVSGVGPYFQHAMFFNDDVTGVAKSAHSDAMLARLAAEGGWGNGDKIQIDTSIDVLAGSSPMMTFTPTDDFYSPDCDHVAMPVPVGGDVEGEDGYACTGDGDCHLIVVDSAAHTLYEMWRANITSTFQGGCLAAWNTAETYTQTLRGDQCTSADAAGLPIAPLLFTADEVAAGHIDHAIRFILPNNRIAPGYVRPATHGTNTTGASDAPPYGSHLRLRADYPIDSLPSAGAKVVARALQQYGMYQADGGNIALTAQSDKHTTAKWSDVLDVHDLAALAVSDFDVIDHGATIPVTGDCNR
jgi:serine/threonine-protein kinase